MFRYLMYKKNLYTMEAKSLHKIASNSSQIPHLQLKQGFHKDSKLWLDHWGVKEEIILENKDNIKNTIT